MPLPPIVVPAAKVPTPELSILVTLLVWMAPPDEFMFPVPVMVDAINCS
jgi:hypothetical protein